METKIIQQKQGSISLRDLVKSAIAAAVVPALVTIQSSIDKGVFDFDWKVIGMTAIGTFAFTLIRAWLLTDRLIVIPPSEVSLDKAAKDVNKVV